MKKIAVIDYGMGNLHSVAKAVESLDAGTQVQISADADTILAADRIIFPGVGAIRDCMAEIRRLGIDEILLQAVRSKPVLAICVGMQALMESSEENGEVPCLGMVAGKVRLFAHHESGDGVTVSAANPTGYTDAEGNILKVPHMGWNQVQQVKPHPLWQQIKDGSRFYFVHSYYVDPANPDQVYGQTDYGRIFTAALGYENLFAVQFHPEKSQHNGLQLLSNFMRWDGCS
ncbi:MAG: imidazole glycerol phosphate synthase subunit HisH [Pseudomonadales bacterium]|nr:imidazole glycerol phosphate synthase subunit HisH [Pseudomonadales bacterium]